MNRPLRARYGAKDNRHDLLDWEGGPALLPPELFGLTDKPFANLAPGECWWPAVGCGPVGDWWAIWWTVPDDSASRGGMVRSEVALWRLDTVDTVDDLRPIMAELAGQETIPPSPVDLLLAVAEALLNADRKHPPVLPDLAAWPGIIADLWAKLWPEARRDFSARVALSPPQGGESIAPPWLFGLPGRRTLEWSGHPVINIGSVAVKAGRAAHWLVGGDDPCLEEMLASCITRPVRLSGLSPVARAADRLDALRQSPNPQQALDLLRTLLIIAPKADTAKALKAEALQALHEGFPSVNAIFVLSLMNLDPAALPAGERLGFELGNWIKQQAPGLPLPEAAALLKGLKPNEAQDWWQQAVKLALSQYLSNPATQWAKAALNWLGLSNCAIVMNVILPNDKSVENCLCAVSSQAEIPKDGLQALRQQTTQRGWSRLHAWAVMKALPPREALQAQRAFAHEPFLGLKFLVEQLPGVSVVSEAIATHDQSLIQLVAQRTAREPDLLLPLDPSKPTWLFLWAEHVSAGGSHWPEGTNRKTLGETLLEAVLGGNEPPGLIAALADDLGEIALQFPKRAQLWEKLSHKGRTVLLSKVAEKLIWQFNNSQDVPIPERKLAEAVIGQLKEKPPSAKVLSEILFWDIPLNEKQVINWLGYPKREEWKPDIAAAVGKAIYSKQWDDAASEIYKYFALKSIIEFKPALEACFCLLSFTRRFWLSFKGIGDRSTEIANNKKLVRQVAELGAELYPDKLEYIWERAGGERKQLKAAGHFPTQWQEAANMANQGALKGGLLALVQELKRDFPHNDDLVELEKLLSEFQRYGR
jgi:hypothetical protein